MNFATNDWIEGKIGKHAVALPYNIGGQNLTMAIIEQKHYNDAALFVSQVFCEEEPVSRYIGQPQSEIYEIAMDVLKSPANSRASILIRDLSYNVVAVLICEHVELGKYQAILNPKEFSQTAYKLIGMMQKSRVFYDNYYKCNIVSGNVIEMLMLAVSKEYRGCDLSTYLIYGASFAALSKGYAKVICEATNIFSQSIATKNGFKSIYSINYADFKIGGEKVLEKVDESYTLFINQHCFSKIFLHTASRCHLMEAALEEVFLITSKKLNI